LGLGGGGVSDPEEGSGSGDPRSEASDTEDLGENNLSARSRPSIGSDDVISESWCPALFVAKRSVGCDMVVLGRNDGEFIASVKIFLLLVPKLALDNCDFPSDRRRVKNVLVNTGLESASERMRMSNTSEDVACKHRTAM